LRVAKTTAMKPKIVVSVEYSVPVESIAPIIVIPDIAFEPDIRGVCNIGGTLVITSKPTNIARINIVRTAIVSPIMSPLDYVLP
tara:strand:+ start:68081 stop:68332 length:252 start_codon:yes stop_codon:yes gene_type:complete